MQKSELPQLSPVEVAFLRFKGINEGTKEFTTQALNPHALSSSLEFRAFVAGVQYGALDGVTDEDQSALSAASNLGQPAARRLDEEQPLRTLNTNSGVPESSPPETRNTHERDQQLRDEVA